MTGFTVNPVLTTNGLGGFSVQSEGYVSGTVQDDPIKRYDIVSGIVSPAAAGAFYGGMGITENLTTAGTENALLGSVLALATAEANLTGFTVFNQSTAMVQTAQSPVPQAAQGMGINFVRLGSGARIVLPCSSTVATAFLGGAANQAVYWDYTNQVALNAPGGTALPGLLILDVIVGNVKVPTTSSGQLVWNNSGSGILVRI